MCKYFISCAWGTFNWTMYCFDVWLTRPNPMLYTSVSGEYIRMLLACACVACLQILISASEALEWYSYNGHGIEDTWFGSIIHAFSSLSPVKQPAMIVVWFGSRNKCPFCRNERPIACTIEFLHSLMSLSIPGCVHLGLMQALFWLSPWWAYQYQVVYI